MIKPSEQKEAPKDEPKQKAPSPEEPGRRTGQAALARGAERRTKLQRGAQASAGTFMEEGTGTLNESNTIGRWKSLAGIK